MGRRKEGERERERGRGRVEGCRGGEREREGVEREGEEREGGRKREKGRREREKRERDRGAEGVQTHRQIEREKPLRFVCLLRGSCCWFPASFASPTPPPPSPLLSSHQTHVQTC